MNYLRPNVKRGNISLEEEELIIRLHKLLGNRWSLIAGRVPGRTDNEIKNYWNTHLSKKLRCNAILQSASDYRASSSHSDVKEMKPFQPFQRQFKGLENQRSESFYDTAEEGINSKVFNGNNILCVNQQYGHLLNSSHFDAGYFLNNQSDITLMYGTRFNIADSLYCQIIDYGYAKNQCKQLYSVTHDLGVSVLGSREASQQQQKIFWDRNSCAFDDRACYDGRNDLQGPPQFTSYDELLSTLFDESTMDVPDDIQNSMNSVLGWDHILGDEYAS